MDFVRTTMNLLAEKSAGYFVGSFGLISLFMDLFSRSLCVVSINICTYLPVYGLNDMKPLLDFKLPPCFESNAQFVVFLLGDSPASEFYVPTFRNTLSVPSS